MDSFPSTAYDNWKQDAPDDGVETDDDFEPDHDGDNDDQWLEDRGLLLKPVEEYRGYRIYYDPPPIPTREADYQFAHKEYDGPEDKRCGFAGSVAACKKEIDIVIEEDEYR